MDSSRCYTFANCEKFNVDMVEGILIVSKMTTIKNIISQVFFIHYQTWGELCYFNSTSITSYKFHLKNTNSKISIINHISK